MARRNFLKTTLASSGMLALRLIRLTEKINMIQFSN